MGDKQICKYYTTAERPQCIYNILTGELECSYLAIIGRCLGTRELEECHCNGDESKCDLHSSNK